ncbi:hypothetical protein IH781_03475, partial [Patescibacteria group bacterium]|nr:hypothetical protein [Patescibacteria group bacterium]
WLNGKPRLTVHRWQVSKLVLVTVLLSSTLLVWHVSNLSEARGVSGGDPYNFFFIVERIQTNLTFYNPEQKRLPVWPLVLIPSALSTSDIVLSARLINLFIAAATLLVLAWLGTQLKLPRPAIALAVLLTALNRDFMLITYRPLAYPLVGLLLLLSLTTLFWAKTKPRRLIPAGILFGLAAQTRQEAIIVAGLVIGLACLVLMLERRWRCILALALPALLVMSPYFIANASFFGNPFYSAYLDHPVTNVDRSLGEVQENIGQGWAVISSSWWHVWGHQRRITLNTFTLVASLSFPIIIGAALLRRRFLPKILYFNNASPPLAVIALLVLFPLWLKYKTAVPTNLNTLLVLISALGLIALLWHSWQMWQPMKPGRNLLERIPIRIYLVLLTGTSLAGIATWVHPVAKTYYSFIPYLGLVAGLGLYLVIASLFKTTNKSFLGLAGQWLGLALVFSMLSLPLVLSANRLHAALDSFSRKNVEDWLFYNMSRYLADSGSTDKATMYAHFLPAQYFLGGDTIVTSLPEDPEPSAALLRDKKVRWIFWTSHLPLFNTFASDPSRYPVRYSIKAFGRDDVLFEGRVIELPP